MLTLRPDKPLLLGVVHLMATPGSPRFCGSVASILEAAVRDAQVLLDHGCDGLVVENFGDVPFFRVAVPSETIATMALALQAVLGLGRGRPIGVNVLRNDVRAALGLCAATGADFVRVNVHTGVAVTDQGLVEGCAAETLRERSRLCPNVQVLADVHVKHATPLSRETIAEAAADTVHRGLADMVIVSGVATGKAPSSDLVREVRAAAGTTPILLGSGVDEHNARELLTHADGAIIGTALKRSGRVENEVEATRVAAMRRIFDGLER